MLHKTELLWFSQVFGRDDELDSLAGLQSAERHVQGLFVGGHRGGIVIHEVKIRRVTSRNDLSRGILDAQRIDVEFLIQRFEWPMDGAEFGNSAGLDDLQSDVIRGFEFLAFLEGNRREPTQVSCIVTLDISFGWNWCFGLEQFLRDGYRFQRLLDQ